MIRKLCIYTTVVVGLTFMFLGCNPSDTAVLSVDRARCTACTRCLNVCKADAVRIISNKAIIDPTKCIKCGNCVEICPENAIN